MWRNPIVCSTRVNVTVRFCFDLPLTCHNRIGLWSAECGQVSQQQQVFAGQSPCARTLNQVQVCNFVRCSHSLLLWSCFVEILRLLNCQVWRLRTFVAQTVTIGDQIGDQPGVGIFKIFWPSSDLIDSHLILALHQPRKLLVEKFAEFAKLNKR